MISIFWILWHFGVRGPAPCWEKLRLFAQSLLSWRLMFWTFFFFKWCIYSLDFFFFCKSSLRWMFLHLIDGDFWGSEDRNDLSRSSWLVSDKWKPESRGLSLFLFQGDYSLPIPSTFFLLLFLHLFNTPVWQDITSNFLWISIIYPAYKLKPTKAKFHVLLSQTEEAGYLQEPCWAKIDLVINSNNCWSLDSIDNFTSPF